MKLPPLVEVEWVDSVATVGWTQPGEQKAWINAKLRLYTAGYLISDTKREVTVATSINPEDGAVSGMFLIPRSCVRKVRRLK